MKSAELLRCSGGLLLAVAVQAAWAQDAAKVAAPAAAVSASAGAVAPVAAPSAPVAAPPVKERNMTARFSAEKPVLGMPLGSSTTRAHCSTDGTAFYDLTASGTSAGQQLYGISPEGGVKHLLRKLPIDYTNVLVRDFFAGDKQLVTLLQAEKRDDGPDAPPRVTDYFLSLEDEAGDLSELVAMSVRFKPVKVARFASGDVMALGWDEGNLLPVLAIVKEDGSVRRFVDLDAVRPGGARGEGTKTETAIVKQELATLESLQGATFVPDGNEVLLTWPGTTKPVIALGAAGEERTIPIAIPAGYVLNDVLASSGGRGLLVVRVKEADVRKPAADEVAPPPKMMLLEYDAVHGSRIGRVVFDKPKVEDVTCAPNSLLTAVFYDTIPDANRPVRDAATGAATSEATQLVVATARQF